MDRRIPAWTFILLGIALFICGLYASQRFSEPLLDKIMGHHTNYTLWYLITGIFAIVIGLVIRFRRNKKR